MQRQFYFKSAGNTEKYFIWYRNKNVSMVQTNFKHECTSNNQMLLTDGTFDTLSVHIALMSANS